MFVSEVKETKRKMVKKLKDRKRIKVGFRHYCSTGLVNSSRICSSRTKKQYSWKKGMWH